MRSHILLLFMIDDDGWHPMKFFEYLSANAQVLATPSDQGVVEELLSKSGKGVALNNADQVASWLKEKWIVVGYRYNLVYK